MNISLAELDKHRPEGHVVSIDTDSNTSAELGRYGIFPGTSIKVVSRTPFQGPISFLIRNCKVALRHNLAQKIRVQTI